MIKSYKEVTAKERTKVWNESFSDYQTNMTMTENQLDNRLKKLELSQEASFILYKENRPAGITLYGDKIINNKRIAWIGGLAVHPNFRKNGIGIELLNQIEKVAKESEVSVVTLEVIMENIGALKLYERNGYEMTEKLIVLEGKLPVGNCKRLAIDELKNSSEKEPLHTPWQNRRKHGHHVFQINSLTQGTVGERVCDYEVRTKTLIIYQLELIETKRLSDVLVALQQKFGANYLQAYNLYSESYEVSLLKEYGFKILCERYQMEKQIS